MYLVSSCLVGINCKYNGGNSENRTIVELFKKGQAIPVCPEQLAELNTPRPSCEIIMDEMQNKRVVSKDKKDFTKEFIEGAEKVLEIVKILGIKKVILKSKSPSCGCGLIYDGTFSRKLVNGNGLTAELLKKNDIEVYTENDLDKL